MLKKWSTAMDEYGKTLSIFIFLSSNGIDYEGNQDER